MELERRELSEWRGGRAEEPSSCADRRLTHRGLWCLAYAMTLATPAVWLHRGHVYKAIACTVLVLIALQYLLSGGVLDRRSIETIFTINASRCEQLMIIFIYLPLIFFLCSMRIKSSLLSALTHAFDRYYTIFVRQDYLQ